MRAPLTKVPIRTLIIVPKLTNLTVSLRYLIVAASPEAGGNQAKEERKNFNHIQGSLPHAMSHSFLHRNGTEYLFEYIVFIIKQGMRNKN